jgi:dephospho-CoA kinase
VLLVAVTGGIGSGKTTVSASLGALGAPVVDADGIAREVVEPDGAAYGSLRRRFGPDVFSADGRLDRPALAAVVFADPAALADLNAITHPVIGTVIVERLEALAGHAGPVVLDVPLLRPATVELYRPAVLLVVDTPEEVAVARLVDHRGFSEADAVARVRAQATRHERRALLDLVPAGRVIDNSGDRASLDAAVADTWGWLRTLS